MASLASHVVWQIRAAAGNAQKPEAMPFTGENILDHFQSSRNASVLASTVRKRKCEREGAGERELNFKENVFTKIILRNFLVPNLNFLAIPFPLLRANPD